MEPTLREVPGGCRTGPAIKRVAPGWLTWSDCTHISDSLLVAPMTLVGLMALSLEIRTKRSVGCFAHVSASRKVPSALFLTASPGCVSIMGTCLWAAA